MSIQINGKTYETSQDGFGITMVDGKYVDKFLDWLQKNDPPGYKMLIEKGADIIATNPAYARDIIDRNELDGIMPPN